MFRSVEQLEDAIHDYLIEHNRELRPFIWTAKASDILEKVKRPRAALDNGQSESNGQKEDDSSVVRQVR